MRKREKVLWIILGVLVIGGLIILPIGKKAYSEIVLKPRHEAFMQEYTMHKNYEKQNKAFCLPQSDEYQKYTLNEQGERSLQVNLNAYEYYSGKKVEAENIKDFLKTSVNKDGTPKTFENDQTGKVREYVQWYSVNKNDTIVEYKEDLTKIFVEYCKRNPNCPYSGVDELPVSELNKLCSLYNGEVETYPYEELELEW